METCAENQAALAIKTHEPYLGVMKPWEIATAKIGGGAVVLQGDTVLLVRLNYGPAKDGWVIPGGRVEANELIHEAVAREVQEETGVEIVNEGMIALRQRLGRDGLTDIYCVFRGKPKRTVTAADLKWDPLEIQDVRFWKIAAALGSPDVRNMSKRMIGTLAKINGPALVFAGEIPGTISSVLHDFVFLPPEVTVPEVRV